MKFFTDADSVVSVNSVVSANSDKADLIFLLYLSINSLSWLYSGNSSI